MNSPSSGSFTNPPGLLFSARLEPVPVSLEMARAELAGAGLDRQLGARLPAIWPPPPVEPASFEWVIRNLEADATFIPWCAKYFVLRELRMAIGLGGFRGPLNADGTVEIGYSVVEEFQRRGYASKAARTRCDWAFTQPGVQRVVAETFPDLAASVGVLRKNGFQSAGAGSKAGTVRFELSA